MKVNKKSNAFTNFDIALSKDNEKLNSSIDEATSTKYVVKNIPIEDIEFNPKNTRFNDDDTDEEIEELAENIELYGLFHPVAVFPHGNKYMLFSGERRTKAYIKLKRREIPAMIYPDDGDLGNMERLYQANLQSRMLDARKRFLAFKDLQAEYESSSDTVKTADIAKKLKISTVSANKYKKLYQNAEDGDIDLLESGEISMEEFERRTMDLIAEREKNQYMKRIAIISDYTEDIPVTNYIDPHTKTVYSVECDEDGKYCTAVTDTNLFKVPLHYQNQVFDKFEEAQVALNLFAISNKFAIYRGDFSEYKNQETPSPSPAIVESSSNSAAYADQESETIAVSAKDYGPSLPGTVPTKEVGGDTSESSNEDSSKKVSIDVPVGDSLPDSTSDSEDEEYNITSDDKESDSTPAEEKQIKVTSSTDSEEVEDSQKKSANTDSDYLKQYATFSGYCPANATIYRGALVYSGTRAFIITQLQVDAGTPVDKVTKKTSALFVEVEPKTVQRYELQ